MRTMHTPSFPRFNLALTAVLIVLSSWTAAAQRSLERAEAFLRAGDWDAAHAALAPEMDQGAYASNARAWFVLGFVQKEQFKVSGASGLDAAERSRAVVSSRSSSPAAAAAGGVPDEAMQRASKFFKIRN